MEKEVMELLSEDIISDAARRYGIEKDSLKLISDFENYIYEFGKDGQDFILRLTHSSHRNENLIEGELDWIYYLHQKGCSVCRPFFSENNRLVERIEAKKSSYFLATAFERAGGCHVDRNDEKLWNNRIFETWGQVIGKMHAVTKSYKPTNLQHKRFEWFDEDLAVTAERYIGRYGEGVICRQRELMNWCYSLPRDENSYGLIHTDVHDGNFFVDGENLTVFDFDDCAYNWFINDIAIVLFYVVWRIPSKDVQGRRDLAERFLTNFLKGYRRENSLDSTWLKCIPNFLKFREMTVFAVLNKKWDLDTLNDRQKALLDNMLYNIENDMPFVDMDFTKFARILI